MSYDKPVSFVYADYTTSEGDIRNEHHIHWRVTYEDGKTLMVITPTVKGVPDTSFIRWIKDKGAKYIPYDTTHDPPIEQIWRSFGFVNE